MKSYEIEFTMTVKGFYKLRADTKEEALKQAKADIKSGDGYWYTTDFDRIEVVGEI